MFGPERRRAVAMTSRLCLCDTDHCIRRRYAPGTIGTRKLNGEDVSERALSSTLAGVRFSLCHATIFIILSFDNVVMQFTKV